MEGMFLISFAVSILVACSGYDILEGLIALSTPCFETIPENTCNTSLPKVFDAPTKGVNINPEDTRFYLFTQKNQDKAEPLHKCGGKLPPGSNFDPNVDTVIICHGITDGVCRSAWMRETRNQLFKRGAYNVILTDWTWGNTFDLNGDTFNTFVVGEQIAFVIQNIMMEKNINGSKFHLIGQSLGSFAVSHAGKSIIKWNKDKILRRITHLDPAVIPLRDEPDSIKQSKNDAKFVDVIHTNGGACFPFFFGDNQTLGHLDFYINGGVKQASCYPYAFNSILKGDFLYGLGSLLIPPLCAHIQSIQFFKASITHPTGMYIGVHCNNVEDFESGSCKRCCKEDFINCAVAGMDAEKYYKPSKTYGNHSKYFFNTYDYCPYPEDYDFSVNKDCGESL